jgi:hypothetical protein
MQVSLEDDNYQSDNRGRNNTYSDPAANLLAVESFECLFHFSSLPKKNQPKQACEKYDDTWVKERDRPDLRIQLESNQKVTYDEREGYRNGQTEHPDRKKGTDNVDGRRVIATGA